MYEQPNRFGQELRRLRSSAGLTLTRLAAEVHYSKGQLSKVERGLKSPSPALARLCDAALDAGGALSVLAPVRSAAARDRTAVADRNGITGDSRADDAADGVAGSEVWSMSQEPTEAGSIRAVGRRQVMTAGAASFLGLGLAYPGTHTSLPTPGNGDAALVEVSRTLFEQFRRLGQAAGPETVLPALTAQAHALHELAARAGSRTGGTLLALASRYAEYAGWMAQEAGDNQAALRWTDGAVKMASATGDETLAAYALVRRALITLYGDDAAQTVQLARQAQDGRLPPRIRGLAAQREAQGHALAGDYDACMHGLDRAREMFAKGSSESGAPVFGTTHVPDPAAMTTGWCLYDLGRPRKAAEVLGRELAGVPAHALRTRARYGMRQALAYAASGEVEHACALAAPLLSSVHHVTSATVATDVRRLARTLSRFPRNSAVQALAPLLV
ncbi:helix-turn-helix domain-containing protein [Streptomyces chrestomyceticus]|uniref:helix-turn-helix domain-containing protein n=1 Tax=Streptomyces chrestomyceticus TaxID=68185 RepID=UPI00368B5550